MESRFPIRVNLWLTFYIIRSRPAQLIKDNPNIQYDKKYQRLKIQPDAQTLNSVNALLKKPLFEIRYLTIKEIYEIEQTLNSPNNQVA